MAGCVSACQQVFFNFFCLISSCLSSSFSFVFPGKIQSLFYFPFLCRPLLRKHYCFLFAISFVFTHFLVYLLLILKQLPRNPLSNPSCFHFWLFCSSAVVLLLFDFLCLCYLLDFVGLFLLCLLSLVLISDYDKNNTLFPCNSSVLVECLLKDCFFFRCFFLDFLVGLLLPFKMKLECFMCVLSLSSKNTTLDCFLVWILLSASFLLVFVFVLFLCLYFSFQSKISRKGTGQKPRKPKMQKNTPKCFSVSAAVFTNSVPNFWGGLKKQICWKHYENSVWASNENNQKWPKIVHFQEVRNWSKYESKLV